MFAEDGSLDWDRIAIVDTETLGLDPRIHPVWDIAIALGERETQEYTWQVEVRDVDITRADPYALEITGFEQRYNLDQTLTPRATAERLLAVLAGRHLIGAVPSFDEERLRQLVWKHLPGATIPWHYHLIDVETLLTGWGLAYGHHPQLPWKSDDLSQLVGVTSDQRHTALGDVRWARAQLVEMVRRSPVHVQRGWLLSPFSPEMTDALTPVCSECSLPVTTAPAGARSAMHISCAISKGLM